MKGISLPSFLQVVELERQTCSVEVKSQGKRGYLQFQGGVLVHALAGSEKGEDAAYDILAWDDPEVDVDTHPNVVEPSIDASVTALLLETSRRKDEQGRDGNGTGNGHGNDVHSLVEAIGPGSLSAQAPAPTFVETPPPSQASAPPPFEEHAPTAASDMTGASAPRAQPRPEPRFAPAATPSAPEPTATHAPAGLLPDMRALSDTVQRVRSHLGDALLAIDVYALGDGQPLAGFNSQPRWAAYLAQMSGRLTETLANCGLPAAGKYYLIDLDAPQSLLVVPGHSLQWSLLFDATRAPLGLVLNVVLPELRAAFGEA
jgi:hypothetical protein